MTDAPLTLATVVHGAELPLLAWQARSLALHGRAAGIARILIILNDVDAAQLRARLDAITPLYGRLADRVEVLSSAALFEDARARGLRQHGLRLLARYPVLQGLRRSGWRGNDGWRLQQACKLAIAARIDTPYTLLLDAKNIFLRPLEASDFISPDGRARTWFSRHDPQSEAWMKRSAAALGQPRHPLAPEITTYITPFTAETRMLRDVLAAIEARHGPVGHFFAFRLNNVTEFMLINAYCNARLGGVRRVFADGGLRSYTIWGDPDLMMRILREAQEVSAKCIGLHRRALPQLDAPLRALTADLLIAGGVIAAPQELDHLIAELAPPAQAAAA